MLATNWTDPTLTASVHIRATHINELRSVTDKNRIVAGLGSYGWTDSPVTRLNHIRASHLTELRTAIQDLWTHANMGAIGSWSYGSAPTAGTLRAISARDVTDLRNWIDQYQTKEGPLYDPNYWGVDSAASANSLYPGTQLTVFDYISQQAGAAPAFWGRYIGGLYSLTSQEITFLHSKNCKILLIYNGTSPGSVGGTYQDGVTDGNNAINAANALVAPAGIVIAADIEGEWTPTPAWIEGWSDTLYRSDYMGAGGLYANTLATNPFNNAYCAAFTNDIKLQIGVSFIWASEPEPGCTGALSAPVFAPAVPPCNDGAVVAWQYAEACYLNSGVAVDEDIVSATGIYYLW